MFKKKKSKILCFYITVSLIFLLSNLKKKKKKNFNMNKKIEKIFQNCEFNREKIRGNILKIFKPLDSKFRPDIQTIFKQNQMFLIVDNTKTVIACLEKLKCFLNLSVLFYPLKSGEKNFKNMIKKRKISNFRIDYDEYDSFIPNLILKISCYKSSNFKRNLFENPKMKRPIANLTNKIRIYDGTRSVNNSGTQKKEGNSKLKISLKTTFEQISGRLNEINNWKKINKKKEIFLKTLRKFVIVRSKEQSDNFQNSKNFSTIVCIQRINIFREDFMKIFRFYSCLILVNRMLEHFIRKKKVFKFHETQILSHIYKSQINPKNFRLAGEDKDSSINFNVLSLKNLKHYLNLSRNNLNMKLKNVFNHIKFFKIFSLSVNFFHARKILLDEITSYLFDDEKMLNFFEKKIVELKNMVQYKKLILEKNETRLKKISIKNFEFVSLYLEESFSLNCSRSETKNLFFLLDIDFVFTNFKFIQKLICRSKKYFPIKKFFFKNSTMLNINQKNWDDRIAYLDNKFKNFKKKITKNRKNHFIIFEKKKKMEMEIENRFKNYFEDWSKLVRVIYKNLTSNYSNPLGGTIFFDCVPTYPKKKGSIFFSIIPNSKIISYGYLSDGEKTLVRLSIFMAFHYINSSPMVILDEVDSHLDSLNFKKILDLFKKLEKKKGWNIIFITQKIKLIHQFSELIGIYRNSTGSKIHLIKN